MNTTIDLTKLIEQTVDQVHGSDERDLLYQWLSRNGSQAQVVEVDLADILHSETGDDWGDWDDDDNDRDEDEGAVPPPGWLSSEWTSLDEEEPAG